MRSLPSSNSSAYDTWNYVLESSYIHNSVLRTARDFPLGKRTVLSSIYSHEKDFALPTKQSISGRESVPVSLPAMSR
jgi:hypothetical protein